MGMECWQPALCPPLCMGLVRKATGGCTIVPHVAAPAPGVSFVGQGVSLVGAAQVGGRRKRLRLAASMPVGELWRL